MKWRRLALVAWAFAWLAVGATRVQLVEVQPSTRGVPDSGADGLGLALVKSVHAVVSCPDGTVIDGGAMDCLELPAGTQRWTACPPYASYALSNVGGRDDVGPELPVTSPFGRVLFATSGVGCAGQWDGGVQVMLEATQ